MRNCLFSLMLSYAQLCNNAQYPSPTETLTMRLQDDADATAAGDRLHCEGEQVRLVHQASMNAHYEGALGTWPSSYGNSGLNPSNPVLMGTFDLLPSQPCSQNNVMNPVVQPQPPLAVVAPVIGAVDHLPPHGGAAAPNAGVILVAPHPQVAPPPGGGGVVLTPPVTPNGGGGAAGGAAPAPAVGVDIAIGDLPSDNTAHRGMLAHQRA